MMTLSPGRQSQAGNPRYKAECTAAAVRVGGANLAAHELEGVAEAADDAGQQRPVAAAHVPEVLSQRRLWRAQDWEVQEDRVHYPARIQGFSHHDVWLDVWAANS